FDADPARDVERGAAQAPRLEGTASPAASDASGRRGYLGADRNPPASRAVRRTRPRPVLPSASTTSPRTGTLDRDLVALATHRRRRPATPSPRQCHGDGPHTWGTAARVWHRPRVGERTPSRRRATSPHVGRPPR